MSNEYFEILNNFVEMNNFITTITKQQDEYVLGELNVKANMVMGVDIEPKRLEKWVRQAMFIEKFTVDQLRDFAVEKKVRELLKEKDQHISELEEQSTITEKALELACEFNATTTCSGQCQSCLHKEICDNTPEFDFRPLYADYFKNKAKEILKSE